MGCHGDIRTSLCAIAMVTMYFHALELKVGCDVVYCKIFLASCGIREVEHNVKRYEFLLHLP